MTPFLGTRLVTFNHHGDPLELPSCALPSVHSMVVRILHAPGMAKVIDRVLEDAAEIRNLASERSADLSATLAALLDC